MGKSVCIIGAGMAGLAGIRELRLAGHEVSCFEAGSQIGGTWRYENDNGVSPAYRSLHTNVSRRNMQFGSRPMPGQASKRVYHSDMLAYLESYARANQLSEYIRFKAIVQSAHQNEDGSWAVQITDEPVRHYDALVVATGCLWDPNVPQIPGEFSGQTLHVRDYRTPEPFAGKRVLVLGAGQSALDICSEISFSAAHTVLACRQGHHLFPTRLLGLPIDYFDLAILNRVPWPMAGRIAHWVLTASPAAPTRGNLPMPSFSAMEHRWPALVTTNIERALRDETFSVKPGVQSLDGELVTFADGTSEPFDAMVFATGYRINFPFLPDELGLGHALEFPMYRRILSPHAKDLAFLGILDAGAGRSSTVELQARWFGAVLNGRLTLPTQQDMWKAIDSCGERRTNQRFGSSGKHTVLCDRHAYVRVLNRDLASIS